MREAGVTTHLLPLVVVTSLNRMVQTVGVDMPNATVHHRFGEFAQQAGAVPVYADHHADPVALAERVDGVVINGGGDIAPERYGAARREETRDVEPERDEFEIALVRAAADRGIPVLGICRGVQLVNVALGGTLIQDVPDHMHRAAWSGGVHDVELAPGSRLHGLYGRERLRVNSLHHQAIDRLAPGRAAAPTRRTRRSRRSRTRTARSWASSGIPSSSQARPATSTRCSSDGCVALDGRV